MDNWQPPTAAELKVIEARHERSNQISRLMGEYMLKGYKMLDKLCADCGTILLETRDEVDYCVACQDLESETSKDDPAISSTAAAASLLEQNQRQQVNAEETRFSGAVVVRANNEQSTTTRHSATDRGDNPSLQPQKLPAKAAERDDCGTMYDAMQIVKKKIVVLSSRLDSTDSTEETVKLCDAIKSCAECIAAMQPLV